jgi:hypothetical protein
VKTFAQFLLVLTISGCSDDKMPEFTKLDKLRIIALETATPEVNPGATVTVVPWVSDITETTALSDSVSVCVDPGLAFGAPPTCDGNGTTVVLRTNQALTITGSDFTGSADAFVVNIPTDTILFSNKTSQQIWNGVNYLIDYKLKNSSGVEISAVRRIVVSDVAKTAKNTNPVLSSILSEGVAMAALPVGDRVNLSTDLTSVSQETFQSKNSDGNLVSETEQVAVTWMVTDGETKYARSEIATTNLYTAPGVAPTGRKAHIFAVARDNRGGVKVIKVEF